MDPAREPGPAPDPVPVHPARPQAADRFDRAAGALLGLACGDALGLPVEGWIAADIAAAGGVQRLPDDPRVSDDTDLTIAVAESIVAGGGRFDAAHFAAALTAWFAGAESVAGPTTAAAVRRLLGGAPIEAAAASSPTNGAAMRAAPVGIVHAHDRVARRADAVGSARVTHRHPLAIAVCAAQAACVAWCVRSERRARDPDGLVAAIADDIVGVPAADVVLDAYRRAARAVDDSGALGRIGTGLAAIESGPAALWCFLRGRDARETVLLAANAGGDTDTVAAMAGALAGAADGVSGLPAEWVRRLPLRTRLLDLAHALAEVAIRDEPHHPDRA